MNKNTAVLASVLILCFVGLQNKYKENYTNHMKGHYEGGGIDKNTMHAMNVRKLASDVRCFGNTLQLVKH